MEARRPESLLARGVKFESQANLENERLVRHSDLAYYSGG